MHFDFFVKKISEIGKKYSLVPYGTEALGVMRIEKGHAAGNELNGQTTAHNLGLGKMVSKLNDCVGNTMSERDELNKDDALNFMLDDKKFIYDFRKKNDFSDFQFISSWEKNYQSWINNKVFPTKVIKYENLANQTFYILL